MSGQVYAYVMTRAAIYCRISSDRDGDGLGVARQEQDGRELAERLGWTVAAILIDNDKSAYSGKRRPEYERLLAGVEASEYDALIAWHPDRLHRSPKELERFIDVIERHRVQIATCQAGAVDLSTPTGRMTARVVGAVARHESEHKAERLKRKHLELARAGKVSGGGRRAFGYRNVMDDAGHIAAIELDPDEAELVREAADRIIGGDSIAGLCKDWRARRVPTTTDAHWSTTTMRRMLTSPRIAGMRSHMGEAVAEAQWPAIITFDELLQVRAALKLRATQPSGRARRYLLAGMVWCGACGAKMGVRPAGSVRRYACVADRGGCNRCGIAAEQTEALVVEATLRMLDSPGMIAALSVTEERDQSAAVEIADIEDRLRQLAALWADGGVSAVEWAAARDGLVRRREAAEDRVAMAAIRGAVSDLVGNGEALRDSWASRSFAQRRAVVGAAIERVTVAPSRRSQNRFDPERLDLAWRI